MPDSSWADYAVKAAANRSLVVFVGAGVSRSSTNKAGCRPPDWKEFLQTLAKSSRLKTEDEELFWSLLNSSRLLDAAEILRYAARNSNSRDAFNRSLRDAVEGPRDDPFMPSEWHSTIGRINPSVIITTNYDKIFERASNLFYTSRTYMDQGIDSDIRSGVPIILKLHGSIDTPRDIILSRSDYASLHRKGTLALDVVRALMMTRIFLFIGYSLSDPDLQALLQDLFATRLEENETPHLILASDDAPRHDRALLEHCYGVSIVEYDNRNGDFGYSVLREFENKVSETPPSEY